MRVCSPGATCCDNNMARLPFSTTPAQQPIGSSGGFSNSRSVPIPKHLERENQPPEIRRFHDEMTTEPTHSHEHLHQPSTIEPAKGTTCSADGDALAVAWADGQDIFESIKQLYGKTSGVGKSRVDGWTEKKDAAVLIAWYAFLKNRSCKLQVNSTMPMLCYSSEMHPPPVQMYEKNGSILCALLTADCSLVKLTSH